MKFIDIFNLSKYLKRTGDNQLARIGHVNDVITQVESEYLATAALPQALTSAGVQTTDGPIQELLYKEVEISSAQILAMGTTPVELIAAEQDKVYNINKMIIESNPLTTAYTIASQLYLLNGNSGYLISNQIITDNLLNKGMAIVNDMNGFVFNDFNVSEAFFINTPQAVTLTTFTGANPTLGDGSIIVKIWYTIETFGSNL